MSIKSLFEDIADAIREKSGSSDTYTPAEMPSAIRSIPSGSSTASGVSYDNTSSGLTASNVQDAIDELSGDISTINSDLSELRYKTPDLEYQATSNMTYQQVLDWLVQNVDTTKVTPRTVYQIQNFFYRASYFSPSGAINGYWIDCGASQTDNYSFYALGSTRRWWSNSTNILSSQSPVSSGLYIRVYY